MLAAQEIAGLPGMAGHVFAHMCSRAEGRRDSTAGLGTRELDSVATLSDSFKLGHSAEQSSR